MAWLTLIMWSWPRNTRRQDYREQHNKLSIDQFYSTWPCGRWATPTVTGVTLLSASIFSPTSNNSALLLGTSNSLCQQKQWYYIIMWSTDKLTWSKRLQLISPDAGVKSCMSLQLLLTKLTPALLNWPMSIYGEHLVISYWQCIVNFKLVAW